MTIMNPVVGARQQTTEAAPPRFRRRGGFKPMGPFMLKTLEAILKLKSKAYGFSIHEDLCQDMKAIVDLAQVYVALRRLKMQGHVSSDVVPAPSGSRHMVVRYTITKAGAEALLASKAYYQSLGKEGERHEEEEAPPASSGASHMAKPKRPRTRGGSPA